MTAAMLGASPEHVLLVGIVGKCYEPGDPLSAAAREWVGDVIRDPTGTAAPGLCLPEEGGSR